MSAPLPIDWPDAKQRVRCFIALPLPADALQALVALQDQLRVDHKGARWLARESFHLTLRFLDDAGREQVEQISSEVFPVAAELPPFELRMRALEFFPNVRRPRVLVVRFEGPEELPRLAEHCERAAREAGFEPEGRAFKPHVTIARFKPERMDTSKGAGEGRSEIARHASAGLPDTGFTLDQLVIYRSELSPRGARYSRLAATGVG